MGILDDALNSQDAKRSQRLSKEAQKSKIENRKIKEGTYRGIDLVDGTAKVQLDGQTTATSGYKLITNAPLGDGDRVSIRPNGVGMPRADAKNVAAEVAAAIEKVDPIFASLVFIRIVTNNTFNLNATSNFASGGLMKYNYDPKSLRFKGKSAFNLNANTNIPPNPASTSFSFDFVDENNFVSFTSPSENFATVADFLVYFPADIWKKTIDPWRGFYDNLSTAPIELEISLNGVTNLSSLLIDLSGAFYFIKGECQLFPSVSPLVFSFRFRKRVTSGDPLPWFSLG